MYKQSEISEFITTVQRSQNLLPDLDYQKLLVTALQNPKTDEILLLTSQTTTFIAILSQFTSHCNAFAKCSELPDFFNFVISCAKVSKNSFQQIFKAILVNFSVHDNTCKILSNYDYILPELALNCSRFNFDVKKILKVPDQAIVILALKNCFLNIDNGFKYEEVLPVICTFLTFKDMPKSLKEDEADLEKLFIGEVKTEEITNNALDCLMLAGKNSKTSLKRYYGVIRESHLWWAENSENQELLECFNAVGEFCVSLDDGEEINMDEFGVE